VLDLCAGQQAFWRNRATRGDVLLLPRPEGEHPQAHLARYAGILQADAYDGYNRLYQAGRSPGPILEAACWVHARRPFFAMADIEENARRKASGKKEIALSPIAIEIVHRIDALFEIERSINGKRADERLVVRQTLSRPLVDDRQKDLDQRPLRTEVVLVGDAGYLKDPITVQWINEAFRNAFDQVMINYQRDSDAKVLPMYEFSRQLASLELPPPEMQRISAMQR
jgi:hypothetical protein